jgi:hypothetical protein
MKFLFLSILLASCVSIQPNDSRLLEQRFTIATACTDYPRNVEEVYSQKDFMGNFHGGSYEYTCGERKYACKAKLINYDYLYKCESKI